MNATVKLTKDFLKKINKPLTHQQLGKLRNQKILQAEKDGRLSLAKNRLEVAEIVGISKDRLAVANAWVYRQIQLGKLTETLLDFGDDNKPQYEYHFYENAIAKPQTKKTTNHGTKTPKTTETPTTPDTPTKPDAQISQPTELTVPIDQNILEKGLSLTLNINLVIKK